jgi:hypothetical protein
LTETLRRPLGVSDSGNVRSHEEENPVGFSNHLFLANGSGQKPAAIDDQVAGGGYQVRWQPSELMVESSGGIGSGRRHQDVETTGQTLGMGPVVKLTAGALTISEDETGHPSSHG